MLGDSILSENRALNNPHTDKSIVNRIFWFVGLSVALIALGSFTLSFMALHDLAISNGIPAHLGWIWPLIVDVSMVIYTAAILVAQLQCRGAKLPIGMTIFYALVTVTGNLLHAPSTPLGWFVAGLPPLSLILGTEVLRAMAHHIIERNETLNSLQELNAQRGNLRDNLQNLDATIAHKTQELERIKEQIQVAKSTSSLDFAAKMQSKRQQKIAGRREHVTELLQQGLDEKAIAAEVGVKDVRTIRRDIVAISTNGNRKQ